MARWASIRWLNNKEIDEWNHLAFETALRVTMDTCSNPKNQQSTTSGGRLQFKSYMEQNMYLNVPKLDFLSSLEIKPIHDVNGNFRNQFRILRFVKNTLFEHLLLSICLLKHNETLIKHHKLH